SCLERRLQLRQRQQRQLHSERPLMSGTDRGPCRSDFPLPTFGRDSELSASSPGDSLSCLAVCGSAPLGLAFVPELLALGHRKFNLYSAIFEVHTRGDERQPPLLRFTDQLANFFFMHEQLAGTQRSVVEDVAMLVRPDVAVKQPEFAIFDQAIGIFQVGPASSYRFDFRSS